jgi:hypothetical protein|tara:strand:+ start:718 stop:1041 length:324 start_codon:yes stop_codon:yes gene_type:complete
MKNVSNKTVDINDYETRKALQAMSSEELRRINKYVVGILKTRKASKIAEVKQELVEGSPCNVNHPKLSYRHDLVLTKINKTRGVVKAEGDGRFDQGWNVPLQMIEMK